jgi:hypothetical protein
MNFMSVQNFNGSQSSKVTSRKAVNKETPFSPVLDSVRSVEGQVTLGQDFSELLGFFSVRTFPPAFHTHLSLTFKNLASYIEDGCTATLQMLDFVYFFQQI